MGIIRHRVPVETVGFDYKVEIQEEDEHYEAEVRRAINQTEMHCLWKIAWPMEPQGQHEPWMFPTYHQCQDHCAYM